MALCAIAVCKPRVEAVAVYFSVWINKNKCSAFTIVSKQKESGKRKHANLSIGEKLELNKKLESELLIVQVCDEHGVKKQTVSDIRRSKDKLTCYAMKFDVAPSEDRKGAVYERKHMKVPIG